MGSRVAFRQPVGYGSMLWPYRGCRRGFDSSPVRMAWQAPGKPGPLCTTWRPAEAAAQLSVDKPLLSTIGKLTAREDPVHGPLNGRVITHQ
jgi:hypothetical protein